MPWIEGLRVGHIWHIPAPGSRFVSGWIPSHLSGLPGMWRAIAWKRKVRR